MAYSLKDRFPPPPKYYKISDPGAYQYFNKRDCKRNKAPFLSKKPRVTTPGSKLWTHTIYDSNIPSFIPNVTSLLSKLPRFSYEALSEQDLERILCQCGIQNECDCLVEEEEQEDLCQGNVPRCLYKGNPPRSIILGDSGLSVPSKRDHGFKISNDGSQSRDLKKVSDESPPIYDSRVIESTEYYHGCKWSAWTSKRFKRSFVPSPGPADYTIVSQPSIEHICDELNRHLKRKNSKQLRFIEMVQSLNIKEGRPGPASYSPKLPKSKNTQYYGPKADRFPTSKYNINPGPAEYSLKRVFDPPDIPDKYCQAKLPEPACFGIKAQRFKPQREEGASPASYDIKFKTCNFLHCPTAPFGSSTQRFKEKVIYEEGDNDKTEDDTHSKNENEEEFKNKCHTTWEFKSKTIRIKPLEIKNNEPSPADLPQSKIKVERFPHLQYLAPFYSSVGRFEPWNDWMSVQGQLKMPGPAYYCLEKPRCYPAVPRGPLMRSQRFSSCQSHTPAPNEYTVGGGVETVFKTHNERLKNNIQNQHKFHWEPPKEPRHLTYEEREMELWKKIIFLLEVDTETDKSASTTTPKETKSKFLRCFL